MISHAQPLHLRIFLSSPGDVADERGLALQLFERLQYDPLLRGRVTIEAVAWDKPGADVPMLATLTPQEAINQGLPKPSECDIVVVVFWARMGTPLPFDYTKPDGSRYLSGTEWEYEDAMQASRASGVPKVVVYRRTEKVLLDPADANFASKLEQWQRVDAFFAAFMNPDGSIRQGYNQYNTPAEFGDKFETHLKLLIKQLLEAESAETKAASAPVTPSPDLLPLWKGSPFPGLRAFAPADAPIYFGRVVETDGLLRRVSETPFVAVVGASGSGKSSLVGAGLLPRLAANAIEGSKDWVAVRWTPGELASGDPFEALVVALLRELPISAPARDLTAQLHAQPDSLSTLVETSLTTHPEWAEVLLFIDQFEELFTLVKPQYIEPFIDLLGSASTASQLRTVITLRADFYGRSVEYPKLAGLLESGTFPLAAPEYGALYEMITRPAARAGLEYETGLADRILRDTGSDPGALALMAYTLDELYQASQNDHRLTQAEYNALGGVQGAIGTRAETTFTALDLEAQASLPEVFREICEVDERGVAIRQRAYLDQTAHSEAARRLVEALTNARLLVQSQAEDGRPVVEVAHEALLRSWARLAQWIEDTQDELRLVRLVRLGAEEWRRGGRKDDDLLTGTRLVEALAWSQHSLPSADEQRFIDASAAEEDRQKAEDRRITRRVQNFQRASLVLALFVVLALIAAENATNQLSQAQQDEEALQVRQAIIDDEELHSLQSQEPALATGDTPTVTATSTAVSVGQAHIGKQRGTVTIGRGELWTYAGTAGETITVTVLADDPGSRTDPTTWVAAGKFDSLLLVYQPDGTQLAENDDHDPTMTASGGVADTSSQISGLVLPESGQYLLEVRSSYEGQTSGGYTLVIESLPSEAPTYTPSPSATLVFGPSPTLASTFAPALTLMPTVSAS